MSLLRHPLAPLALLAIVVSTALLILAGWAMGRASIRVEVPTRYGCEAPQ